jgi:hypothetical protein
MTQKPAREDGMNALIRLVVVGLIATAVVCPAASADGLPVVGIDAGPEGVTTDASADRYVTVPAHGNTVVARIQRDGGRMIRYAVLKGNLGVPVVAFDGSTGGLSPDGRTLVLIKPRMSFPRKQTTFAILDAWQLRLRDRITLRGDFSFDALSPAGTLLYLVQYVSPEDPSRYLVRVFDTRKSRLLPQPIFDSREDLGEAMRGYPVTRATSPDGRWAYTLYDGAGKHPFVHALDTAGRTARCIDLHDLMGYPSLYDLRLGPGDGGATLTVLDGNEPLAVIDTRTFRVSEPPEPAPATGKPRPAAAAADSEGSVSWMIVAGLALTVVLSAAAGTLALRRRPARAAPRGT